GRGTNEAANKAAGPRIQVDRMVGILGCATEPLTMASRRCAGCRFRCAGPRAQNDDQREEAARRTRHVTHSSCVEGHRHTSRPRFYGGADLQATMIIPASTRNSWLFGGRNADVA